MINRLNVAADRRGWFVLAFAAVALALALDLLVRHDPIGVDFHTYVAAGQTGLEQGWSHLYDQGLVAVEQKELAPGQVAQPFLSPPTVAFVTSPLASIPYDVAYVVWAVFLLAAFAVALAWAGVVIAVLLAVLLTVGVDGMSAYVTQLRGPLPKGADDLTLHGALSATGPLAAVLRVLIVGAVFAAAYRMRRSPGLVVPLAIIASLVISPYLHASDLCMLAAAGWMVWEERPALAWRVPLTLIWVLASPYLYLRGVSPHLKQWPWFEIALLLALVIAAWWPLTAWADSRRRAPA